MAGARMGGGMEEVAEPWSKEAEEVLDELAVSESGGLSSSEASRRSAHFGPNELEQASKTSLWRVFLQQFDDTLVKVLLVAATVSFALALHSNEPASLDQYVEPLVIVLILLINATIGVWQESDAERALHALSLMQSHSASCIRDGPPASSIPSRSLVPGDIILLSAGFKVPADCRIIRLRTATLKAEQASLTGESVSVEKRTEPCPADADLSAKESMAFAGTSISQGDAVAVVTSIGMSTEIGNIQRSITEAENEASDTPLKLKLDDFATKLTKGIGLVCLLVWLINYRFFVSWDNATQFPYLPLLSTIRFSLAQCTYYFKIAVALAVAAIPEGLPAVITTGLALGTRKMARKNAIVRKLHAVETLGSTSVICSDKTGTLTTNQMSACRLVMLDTDANERHYPVTGSTYNPSDGEAIGMPNKPDKALDTLATVCSLCNNANLEILADGSVQVNGEPTEGALKVLVEKMWPHADSANGDASASAKGASHLRPIESVCDSYCSQYEQTALLEFDRQRKSMSVLARRRGEQNSLFVKGAPETVVERCTKFMEPNGTVKPISSITREKIMSQARDMSQQALRCLALAVKSDELGDLANYDGSASTSNPLRNGRKYSQIESGMTFVGLVALHDPPREEVKQSIEECRCAGVRVIVITGDSKATAQAICREIGVFTVDEEISEKSYTGREFSQMSETRQRVALSTKGGLLVSRAEPGDKQQIVRLLCGQHDVVAMTGDGVNDAPALKRADIGIAMGITGTAVAKEASEMVLSDDNFKTIVSAVEEGRSIYDNMKAFIRYMISSNVGEVASIFLTAALGIPEGLNPVQLLWVNLVTDGPPATALSFNPPDPYAMRKAPRARNEPLTTTFLLLRYLIVGLYVGLATTGIFVMWYMRTSFLGLDFSQDMHTPVSFSQLSGWHECESFEFTPSSWIAHGSGPVELRSACDYFGTAGKAKASTLSLTVLVTIEMLNSLNALSEQSSLVQAPPWSNPYLLLAGAGSMLVHCVILYTPFFARIFSTVPLSANEWVLVLAFSVPVVLIEEVLKWVGRRYRL